MTPEDKVKVESAGVHLRVGGRRLRLEYVILAAALAVAGALALTFIALGLGVQDVDRWGYGGLFVVALLRSASVMLPMPGSGLVFVAGGLLHPIWGVPAPLLVGLTAGFAESIGEFTGYGAGMGGSRMLSERRLYQRVKGWVRRRSFVTIFAMSLAPSPVFDVAGLAAGATRIPVRVFYPALLLGKVLRATVMATAGLYGIELLARFF